MTTNRLGRTLQQIGRAHVRRDGAGLSDGRLLERYVAQRDPAAFEGLVRRHGPMVLGVCRRLLGNDADAEDAFQATFLVLVRKAAAVVPREQVGNWLHGVARRTALKARTMIQKRRAKEAHAPPPAGPTRTDDLVERLDDEIGRLPEPYRLPIVLCELEGRSIKEAARQLGWPPGTVASRLSRGRRLLAKRLAPAWGGVGLVGVLVPQPAAALAPALISRTVAAARHLAAGTAQGLVSSQVLGLTHGVLNTMLLAKLKTTAVVVVLVGLLIGMGTTLLPQGVAQEPAPKRPANVQAAPNGGDSDAEFIRRISLDLRGTLPSLVEVHFFVSSKEPKKRDRLVDLLIAERGKNKTADAPGGERSELGLERARLDQQQRAKLDHARYYYEQAMRQAAQELHNKQKQDASAQSAEAERQKAIQDLEREVRRLQDQLRKLRPDKETSPYQHTDNSYREAIERFSTPSRFQNPADATAPKRADKPTPETSSSAKATPAQPPLGFWLSFFGHPDSVSPDESTPAQPPAVKKP